MFKKILLSIVMILISAYLIVSLTAFNRRPEGTVCHNIDLRIQDSIYAGFITPKEIIGLLNKKKMNPIGKPIDSIRTELLEAELRKHPLIDQVECYKTPSNKICIEVSQRIPILRVMNSSGENYYIDNKGIVMPPDAKCVAHLAVATGEIEKSFAVRELYNFALFLQQNSFWEAQIEQIHVLPGKKVEFVPRVGNHIVYLGKLTDYEKKLKRLKMFYEKGLNKVGWNKYSRINVEFSNQVVCTKR